MAIDLNQFLVTNPPTTAPNVQTLPAPNPPSADETLAKNEMGDAELFAHIFADKFIYDTKSGAWYEFTGNYWERDNDNVWLAIGNQVASEYLTRAAHYRQTGNLQRESDLLGRASMLRSKRRVTAVVDWARTLMQLPQPWDSPQMKLTCKNGVIDLQSGQLTKGNPRDYLRAHSPVEWVDLYTPAPLWEKFLQDVFLRDTEKIAFVQRLFGYVLTAQAKGNERILPIFYGTGANGKGTLIETISKALGGDYCQSTNAEALMESRQDGGDRPSPFLISLQGKRLVWASESKQGQRFDAGLVKRLSGGDTLSGRDMYSKHIVSFQPTHTVFLITNPLPHVSADDQAMWDRILPVEFPARFVDTPKKPNERKKQGDIEKRILERELPGVLAWLVRGCLAWQKDGLNPPESTRTSKDNYRESEDDFGLFCQERIKETPDQSTLAKDIYNDYQKWITGYGFKDMGFNAFGRAMGTRYEKIKKSGQITYVGIKLRID